jgi:hypothetical protein
MIRLTTLVLAAACLLGLFPRTAATAPDPSLPTISVRGRILEISTEHRGFMLETRRGLVAVRVTQDTHILINGEEATMNDLRTGMRAGVRGPFSRLRHQMLARGVLVRVPGS